jgi:hypothetical protein
MAKQIVTMTEYTDDLDGAEASRTVIFGYEGVSYEIDLSEANATAFEDAVALYVGHARRARSSRRSGRRSSGSRGDLGAVRAWAAENGMEVAPRGRLSSEILAAYDAAH